MLMGKQFAVVKGSRWKENKECKYKVCGGTDTVRLGRIAQKKNGLKFVEKRLHNVLTN